VCRSLSAKINRKYGRYSNCNLSCSVDGSCIGRQQWIGTNTADGLGKSIPSQISQTLIWSQNNWNALGCDVSESLLLDTSKTLVNSGLRDVGYNYVVLDDCWSDGRDEKDFLKVDMKKFPSGMKSVADEIHREGMLFGMYSSAGEMTCARYGTSIC